MQAQLRSPGMTFDLCSSVTGRCWHFWFDPSGDAQAADRQSKDKSDRDCLGADARDGKAATKQRCEAETRANGWQI